MSSDENDGSPLSARIFDLFYGSYVLIGILWYNIFGRAFPPKIALIGPSSDCNLRCPLCPTGSGLIDYDKGEMSLGTFRSVLSKMPFLRRLELIGWGEPFLNPATVDMIGHAKGCGLQVRLESNFSLDLGEAFMERLVLSGLDRLTVSLDGASQKTYSEYRVGGDFDKVVANIKALIDCKKRMGSRHPTIVWKYIVNRFNEMEIDEARRLAQELGVPFRLERIILADDIPDIKWPVSLNDRKAKWLPKRLAYTLNRYAKQGQVSPNKGCVQFFSLIAVNFDGKVFPCCVLTGRENTFGDMLEESFDRIWNGEKYAQSRALWLRRFLPTWLRRGSDGATVCLTCYGAD